MRVGSPTRRLAAIVSTVAAISAAAYHGCRHPLSAPGRAAHFPVSRKLSQARSSEAPSAASGRLIIR